ncbi:fatty acid desaturase [Coralliovum pocilloporae]|uniref:fatty acid desaturase n=1 Tax=Coralliovum pocilloporae TaxID=3066369 RepID=UPI0033075033
MKRGEWITIVLLGGVYGLWGLTTIFWHSLGLWALPVLALLIAQHSSLQHEALHGHPTRSRSLNELLVFPAVGLFIPYRRFRTLHLRHHNDERLTDPYDDPETAYCTERHWRTLPRWVCHLLMWNNTLFGRLVIGPVLTCLFFWRDELKLIVKGDREVLSDWLMHGPAVGLVLGWLVYWQVDLWIYVLGAALPGLALLKIRTYAEHVAKENVLERTAIIESSWFFSLLFLNNNLHAVHHRNPTAAWYELPRLYRERQQAYLDDNNHYRIRGYRHLFRAYALKPKESVVHPFIDDRQTGSRPL